MTSACSNPLQPCLPILGGWGVEGGRQILTSLPWSCTSSVSSLLPKITQPEMLFNNSPESKALQPFYPNFVRCPLCFSLSSSLAASCTPNGFGWCLTSCAFSLAYLRTLIKTLICQVTDDQWWCWFTCFVSHAKWGEMSTLHKHTSMQADTPKSKWKAQTIYYFTSSQALILRR